MTTAYTILDEDFKSWLRDFFQLARCAYDFRSAFHPRTGFDGTFDSHTLKAEAFS